MKIVWALEIALLGGCGGTTVAKPGTEPGDAAAGSHLDGTFSNDSGSAPAADPDAPIPGVGPIDASNAPTELVFSCGSQAAPIVIKLPCAVGLNLLGGGTEAGFNELECEELGNPGRVALSLMIPLGSILNLLNQPLKIPFDVPPGPPSEGLGKLEGTVVFSQIDPQARAFVGVLREAQIDGASVCTVTDGPFWAIAGGFL